MTACPPFRVVIPARFGASRLPGKPLRALAGRPLIAHVLDRARESGALEVLVATDDARIASAVRDAGATAVMTSPAHPSGTCRLAEVAAQCGWPSDAIVVNLQGDEPFVPGAWLGQLASALERADGAGMATLATPLHDPSELWNPNVVKVVLQRDGHALYFSRAPIPWVRGGFRLGEVPPSLPAGMPFLRHLGLYAYRVAVLAELAAAPSAVIEEAESLEQLRALAMGIRIHVTVVDAAPGPGIDTEEDLQAAEALLVRHAGAWA